MSGAELKLMGFVYVCVLPVDEGLLSEDAKKDDGTLRPDEFLFHKTRKAAPFQRFSGYPS
jgi:hypothetical protein